MNTHHLSSYALPSLLASLGCLLLSGCGTDSTPASATHVQTVGPYAIVETAGENPEDKSVEVRCHGETLETIADEELVHVGLEAASADSAAVPADLNGDGQPELVVTTRPP